MSQFTLVINNLTGEELEKIIGIQVRSEGGLTFVPQGLPGQTSTPNVYSPTMVKAVVSTGSPPKSVVIYNFVRLEWDLPAAKYAAELFALFTREDQQQHKIG